MSLDSYSAIGDKLRYDRGVIEVEEDVRREYGIPRKIKGKDAAIFTFNQLANHNGLASLRDPMGYMTLKTNAYDYLKSKYEMSYEDMADKADAGEIMGGYQAYDAILDHLNKVVMKDTREFLPKSIKYTDLRFTPVSDEIKSSIDDLVKKRTLLTYSFANSRQFERSRLQEIKQDFEKAGERFGKAVSDSWKGKEKGSVLSIKTLLDNANGNQAGLEMFEQQLANPDQIKGDNQEDARAYFETDDKTFAKFLLANRKYLQGAGFAIEKSQGRLAVSWTSPKIEEMWSQGVQINLDGLDSPQKQQSSL